APAPSGGSSEGDTEGLVLSPVVRRLINEHGLDPTSIEGTGAGGRITRNDVLAAVEGGGGGGAAQAPATPSAPAPAAAAPAPAAPAAAPAPAAKAAPTPPKVTPATPGEADTAVPFNNIRKRTGEHMVRSKATSPHVFTVMEVDLEGVEKVRRAHKERFKAEAGISLTYLPFIARALVDAIDEFPHMNASVGDGELVVHHKVGLGIAVDLDYEGLIVPVIHDAQDLRLPAIARSVADLAGKARTRKLSADDISGGTFTITNAGASGTLVQLPIINQPQVAILSTEGVTRRPVVVTDAAGNEAIAIRSIGNLSLAWDHRAFDGAYAAAFLRRVVDILEQRDWEAEL
ncbi:MAG TPA: dihydrolipoamide acetyltransferase family protein, partial [Iamia sp.]|nr:dihydrolipoamide acetyltransferase family protein [Iamia sp.]